MGTANAGALAPTRIRPRTDKNPALFAAVVNTTVVAGEDLTVGSTVWLPAERVAPGR
jgi:hypothetical protein